MKYIRTTQSKQLLLRRMLYLRYQTSAPDRTMRPPAILPLALISELLKVPVGTLTWMHRQYFETTTVLSTSSLPTLNVKASGPNQVTVRNITDEEVGFVTSQESQRRWAILSIEKRCTLFHRQYPDRRIRKGVMLKVMKLAGLKRKKVEVCNVPAR